MKKRIRLILNIVIFFSVIGAWIYMVFSGGGSLSSRGLRSLRYFTVLSNLLEGAACLMFIITSFIKSNKKLSEFTENLKFTAAVSVALTFSVVTFFLSVIYGFMDMFRGANLWFHLIIPLASAAELIVFSDKKPSIKINLLTTAPVIFYGIGYVINILINGIGEGSDTNDWYAFLAWGYPSGIIIFMFIIAATFGIGALLRALCGIKIKKTGSGKE